MLNIITLNVNGLRSTIRKGFRDWIINSNADIICVQEIRIKDSELSDNMRNVGNYKGYFNHANRPGYSGVGIYTKLSPIKVIRKTGIDIIDDEGRYIELIFRNFSIISIYVPSGSSSVERLSIKFKFMKKFYKYLSNFLKRKENIILCGDWNIAHKEIDLKNWKANKKNSGFLPEERAWLDKIINNLGLKDVYRELNPKKIEYTWWSNRGGAFKNNVGWRIDYQFCYGELIPSAYYTEILKEPRLSDHAPLRIKYHFKLK